MDLTELEADFISDLAQDSHGLYEVFFFVRHHDPTADDGEVLRRGRELIATWIERGWLAVSRDGGASPLAGVDGLLEMIDEHGVAGTYGFEQAPWIILAPQAYVDVAWLHRSVD
jgi:hypothetical protein